MIFLKSVIDGCQVILGTYLLHLAALITMVICIRIPEYENDETRNSQAVTIFWLLLAMHFVLAVYQYLRLFWIESLDMAGPILMFGVVVIMTDLAGTWFFRLDKDETSMTLEQRVFEQWLAIELILLASYIGCSSFYILVCKIQRPSLEIFSPHIDPDNPNFGFMKAHSLLISICNVVFSSAFICAVINNMYHPESDKFRTTMRANMILHIIQISTLILAVFIQSVSHSSKAWQLKFAPLATYYCSLTAC